MKLKRLIEEPIHWGGFNGLEVYLQSYNTGHLAITSRNSQGMPYATYTVNAIDQHPKHNDVGIFLHDYDGEMGFVKDMEEMKLIAGHAYMPLGYGRVPVCNPSKELVERLQEEDLL